MKKTFAAAFAGIALAASAAAAGDTSASGHEDEIVLAEDDAILVIADKEAGDRTNGFMVMCRDYPMRALYTDNPDLVVVRLYHSDRTAMTGMLTAYESRRDAADGDAYQGNITHGLIGRGNNLILTYTFNEHIDALRDFLAAPDPLPASATRDPALVAAVRRHGVDFCLSRY